MKLVIDIDEKEYKAILHCAKNTPGYLTYCEWMIADGKPLPKGHGDLIDRSKLKVHYIGTNIGTDCPAYLLSTVDEADVVIEADEAESEVQDADSN